MNENLYIYDVSVSFHSRTYSITEDFALIDASFDLQVGKQPNRRQIKKMEHTCCTYALPLNPRHTYRTVIADLRLVWPQRWGCTSAWSLGKFLYLHDHGILLSERAIDTTSTCSGTSITSLDSRPSRTTQFLGVASVTGRTTANWIVPGHIEYSVAFC